MRRFLPRAAILIGVFAVLSTPLFAQWPPYPTPAVPRTSDGEPDLEGPLPRTADGKPDLSGIWDRVRSGRVGEQGRPVGEPRTPAPGAPPFATFWEIGFGFEDGLPFRPWARALKEQRMADESGDITEVAASAAVLRSCYG